MLFKNYRVWISPSSAGMSLSDVISRWVWWPLVSQSGKLGHEFWVEKFKTSGRYEFISSGHRMTMTFMVPVKMRSCPWASQEVTMTATSFFQLKDLATIRMKRKQKSFVTVQNDLPQEKLPEGLVSKITTGQKEYPGPLILILLVVEC